ncbi:MAG: endonuclease III [Candidatus Omnitrophica bacterium]|nr:endonuclease III [Candidatus Omnitrophota bacterium]
MKALKAFALIKIQAGKFILPSVTRVSFSNNPYKVLISCVLSLRTKDKTTIAASKRLFKVADSPRRMIKLTLRRLEKIIYPVGFYRNKAKVILGLSRSIIKDFKGLVPGKIEKLLGFRGVGRKTANLVLGLGFGIPAICVDTHVHRISNRLGWIKTKTPEDTEKELMNIFPRKLWIGLNTILVSFGQNLCLPVSPFCSICTVADFCNKAGVKKSR